MSSLRQSPTATILPQEETLRLRAHRRRRLRAHRRHRLRAHRRRRLRAHRQMVSTYLQDFSCDKLVTGFTLHSKEPLVVFLTVWGAIPEREGCI